MNTASWWGALDSVGFQTMRALLSVLWQSSILLGAVAGLTYVLRRRRASVRQALWAGALLAAPVLPLLAWVGSNLGTPQAEIPVMPAYSVLAERRMSAAPPAEFPQVPPVETAFESPVAVPQVGQEEDFTLTDYPWALALLGYTSGLVLFLGLIVVGRFHLGRWVRTGATVTDARVVGAFGRAAQRLGVRPDPIVVEGPHVQAPITMGTLRPRVLLPTGFVRGLSGADLRAVALHEMAHVKRHDPLLLALASLVRAVFFFHPLVWLACRQVSLLAEQAADDAVLDATGKPIAYAKMLARLAEDLRRRSFTTELAAGILLSKGAFLRRVEAILSDRRHQIRRLSRWALAGTVLAALLSLALAAALPLGERQPASPETDADINLEDIFERIRQRQARVKTVRYTWTSKKVVPKGTMTVLDPATGGLPVPSDLPTEDTEIERTCTMLIDGQKVRYDDEGLVWFEGLGTGEFVPFADTLVFGADGVERLLLRLQDGSTPGLIGPLRHATARVWYQAMLQAYRLLDPVLGKVRPDEVQFVGRTELRGHPCLIIEKRREMVDQWWLAEDMDYCVLRWETRRGTGEVFARVDMEHEPDEQIGWRLKSWSLTTWPGARGEPITATNVPTEIRLNEPIDPKAFDITFPPGTSVSDRLRGVVYVVGDESETYPAESVEDGMSFEERVLRVKLKSRRLSFYFTDAPLADVLDFVRVAAPINIVADQRVLAERDDLRVTLSLRQGQAELAEALDIISDALGLTWTIRDNAVHIAPAKEEPKPDMAAQLGQAAPELVLEQGAGVTLAQFTGKPVVLAFVSIYSRPCVKVLDEVKALQQQKGADKLAVIAVHDQTATPEEIEQFRKDHSIPFPIVRVPDAPRDGWDSTTFRAYGVTAVPTVVLIDAEGKLVSSGDGTSLDQELVPRDTRLTPSPTAETAVPESASAPAAAKTEGPPRILSTAPPAGATDVDPHLSEISVTFDRDMARGFSWTGGGQVYPEVTDRPRWVDNRTCVLPVKLEEGRYYRVGINSKSHRNFKAAYGAPALPTAIYFCTKGSSDQTKQKVQVPEVVRLVPASGAKDVSPETKEIQVTFSVPMGGGFSWTGGGVNYPEGAGKAYWSDDGKTCTRPVHLRPGWNYRLGLNSPSHNNFQSRWGVPLPRVVWTFSTSGQTPRQGQTTEKSGEPDKTVVVGQVTDIDIVLDQPGRD